MKLPSVLADDNSGHMLLLLLCTANLLLIVIIFFLITPLGRSFIPQVVEISSKTPFVGFNLISPEANSSVSGKVPLITTLTNGPKIISAQLFVDGQEVQAVTSDETDRLTLFWDTTKHQDGKHKIEIRVLHNTEGDSLISTNLIVQNNTERNISSR